MITVNGHPIPEDAIEFELRRLIQFYAQHMPEEQIRSQLPALRKRAAEQAIGAFLLMDEASKLDIQVSEDEVEARVQAMIDEAGGERRFLEILQKRGTNRVEFTEQMRRGRRVDKLVERVTADVPDPSEDEIRRHFEEHQEEYSKSEQAQAQHILISPRDESADAKQEALGRINTLRKRIEEGADFSELAAAHSECPSGREAGGSLGWFGRGAMVPEFDEAVFSMADGDLSQAIETQFGFHLIKRNGYQEASTPDLDDVHDQVLEFLRHVRRGEVLAEHVEELRQKATITEK
jgi:parvulin-like peptidyl-prolyl isomerase